MNAHVLVYESEVGLTAYDSDKNAQQSAIEDGATAMMVAILTKEGRRRCGAGQGNNEEEETIGELAIVASTPPT